MSTSASIEILAQKYIPYAEMLAKIGNNAVFIVDKDEHYYFISDKFKLFGYDDIPQNNSNEIQDYPLKRRIHPDDLAMKELIDEKIREFLAALPKEVVADNIAEVGHHTIRGIVVDEDQKPIAAASVRLVNTTLACGTNAKGEFVLQVKQRPKYTLVVQALGYTP